MVSNQWVHVGKIGPGPGVHRDMTQDLSPVAHDPRAEASALLGGGDVGVVLEPSPPFDDRDPAYLADDPVGAVDAANGEVVSPVGTGTRSWDDVVGDRTDLADWAASRWLTSGRRLATSVPDGYHEGRLARHRLAVYVLSPARMAAIGKMALRHTHGGFGTSFFGADQRQLRVRDGFLIDQRGNTATAHELGSLRTAAEFAGVEIDTTKADEFDVPTAGDPDAADRVDPEIERFLADWYGFSARVLETVRAEVDAGDSPSRLQLWPEHFDLAFEAGSEDAGRRAGFGASPGDHHDGADPEPYLYVSLWARDQVPDAAIWNADFGAKLPFADLVAGDDHEATALEFFRAARRVLAS
jgi:hypothetical protein